MKGEKEIKKTYVNKAEEIWTQCHKHSYVKLTESSLIG